MNSASTSLLTEHLRWTPLSLIDDVINTVNALLYQSVAAVETFLLNSPPSLLGFTPPPGKIPDTDGDGNIVYSEKEEEEINKGIHQLETLLENGVDKSFDRFELYVLRNILVVPSDLVGWVRLGHHKHLDFSTIPLPPDSDTASTTATPPLPPAHEAQSRLRTLRHTLLASHALNQSLQSEVTSNNRTLAQLRLLVSSSTSAPGPDGDEVIENPFSFLNTHGNGIKEAKDTASFAVSQVELIRSLVASLRPKYDAFKKRRDVELAQIDMKDEDTEMTDAPSAAKPLSAEEERKRYIERMTRRHMEASRGLRLNAKGEVVGGDFEGVAKKKIAEVEALEGIVEGMGVGKKEEEEKE